MTLEQIEANIYRTSQIEASDEIMQREKDKFIDNLLINLANEGILEKITYLKVADILFWYYKTME